MSQINLKLVSLLSLFFLAIFSLLIAPVEATSTLNMTAIKEGLADNLNVSSFAGGLLASVFLELIVLLPIAIWERRGWFIKFIGGFSVMGFCVAVDWLPSYFLIIVGLMVALMLASRSRRWFTG